MGVGQPLTVNAEIEDAAGGDDATVRTVFLEALLDGLQAGVETITRRHAEITIHEIAADLMQIGVQHRFPAHLVRQVTQGGGAARAVRHQEAVCVLLHVKPRTHRIADQRQRIQAEGQRHDDRQPRQYPTIEVSQRFRVHVQRDFSKKTGK